MPQKNRKNNSPPTPNSALRNIDKILLLLKKEYPDARCTLNFSTPIELLIATILAAQCTDERVNQVTVKLFKKYRRPQDYLKVELEELEEDIRPAGFFRNKARSIRECVAILVCEYGGKVPEDMEKLVELPGVGRKTANVVLGNAFGIPGIVVDTHVGRVAQRLGLTSNADPVKIEFDLMEIISRNEWTNFSHQIVFHGRTICAAKTPLCESCVLKKYCLYYRKEFKNDD
jgi:endonuclease-3